MKIKKLTITKEELNIAVQAYLKTQVIDLPVESVEKDYSYHSDYTVEFVEAVKAAPPQPEPVETTETVTKGAE